MGYKKKAIRALERLVKLQTIAVKSAPAPAPEPWLAADARTMPNLIQMDINANQAREITALRQELAAARTSALQSQEALARLAPLGDRANTFRAWLDGQVTADESGTAYASPRGILRSFDEIVLGAQQDGRSGENAGSVVRGDPADVLEPYAGETDG